MLQHCRRSAQGCENRCDDRHPGRFTGSRLVGSFCTARCAGLHATTTATEFREEIAEAKRATSNRRLKEPVGKAGSVHSRASAAVTCLRFNTEDVEYWAAAPPRPDTLRSRKTNYSCISPATATARPKVLRGGHEDEAADHPSDDRLTLHFIQRPRLQEQGSARRGRPARVAE